MSIGDSGSGFVCNEILIGLVSFGHKCALIGIPGVYTRVDIFRDWIRKESGIWDFFFCYLYLAESGDILILYRSFPK